jgi:hypothetical protein
MMSAKKSADTILKIVIAEQVSVQMKLSKKQAAAVVFMIIAALFGSPHLQEFITHAWNLLSQ